MLPKLSSMAWSRRACPERSRRNPDDVSLSILRQGILIMHFLSLGRTEVEEPCPNRRLRVCAFACSTRMSVQAGQMWSNGIAKCRQARMKIARHGAAAECRIGKGDDLSPALAGRLNRSLQKSHSL